MVSVSKESNRILEIAGQEVSNWMDVLASHQGDTERALIQKAIVFAQNAHQGQTRASGEPYINHSLSVAEIVVRMNLDHETICAALLHDVVEDTGYKLEDVEQQFGTSVARLVDGVTKMGLIGDLPGTDEKERKTARHDESLRKLLLAMVEDIRVVLIKLADRLHNMRTLNYLNEDRRRRIARETLDIFAPLANRLGIWQIKWELEDLSLRYLEPKDYKRIAGLLDERRLDRERYIQKVVATLSTELRRVNIDAEVSGRPKHIYSIWRKMKRKRVPFKEIYDVRAVRVLVKDVASCYAALGVVHTLWRHIPREFDDYIATPKENNYQSLHTAVVGLGGKALEVQIRTHDMHGHAELGVAAHWAYKEDSKHDNGLAQKINWLRQLLEWKEEEANASDFISRFQSEVFEDRVYVLTPLGNVLDLPAGSTPLDFAYYIHTDVGHRCRGAKVDGSIVPLTYELKTGEQIEILTARNGHPSRDWLNAHLGYLKTSRAKAKVRSWFKHQNLEENITEGRTILERELRRLGVADLNKKDLASRFHFQKIDELWAAIGRGELTTSQVANAAHESVMDGKRITATPPPIVHKSTPSPTSGDIQILGVGNLLTTIAGCCKPVPNDQIVGYITKGRGASIHRKDCPNVLRLQQESRERLIDVSWSSSTKATYSVDIRVEALDRPDLLRDIVNVLSNEKINISGVNTITDQKDQIARMSLVLEINDASQLSQVLSRIDQLPNVMSVKRQGTSAILH